MTSGASRAVAGLGVALVLALAAALWAYGRMASAQADLVMAQAELVAAQASLTNVEAGLRAAQMALVLAEATAKAEKEAAVNVATYNEKWKQKASGKVKRLAAAVPVIGAAGAVWFEEREYREWRQEHTGIVGEVEARRAYYKQIYTLSMQVIDEEFSELKSKSPDVIEKVKRTIDDWYSKSSASTAS